MNPFPKSGEPPRARDDNAQAPLGPDPSYDDVLDVAVQYTFPASDPIAVQAAPHAAREEGGDKGPGRTFGHGGPVEL